MLGGIHCVRQVFDLANEAGVGIGGILPDLPGVGRKIDFFVFFIIQNAALFVVQIEDHATVLLGLIEEGFVSADDFGILLQSLANPLAKANQLFHALGGQEGI